MVVLAPLLMSDALGAAELVVRTDRPCIVVVNLVPYPTSGGDVTVDLPSGKEGEQNVRIRNLLGEQQWAGKVEVPPDTRRLLKWELGHMNMEPPEPLRGHRPKLSDRDGPPTRPGAKPEPAPVEPLPEDPFVSAVADANEQGGGGNLPAPAPAPEAPPSGGTGAVTLANRTGSWANVRIDGALHEFRGDLAKTVALASGVHRVEIGEFRDKETWWSGELWIWPDFTVELQFSEAAAPVAINRAEAWHP